MNFNKVWQILQILLALFKSGHDIGLYDKSGSPISSVDGLKAHLDKQINVGRN